MKVNVTPDINRYQTKSVGIFSAKQILFALIGISAAAIMYMLCSNLLPTIFATAFAAAFGLPIAALGFLQIGGVPATDLVGKIVALPAGKGKKPYAPEEVIKNVQKEK